MLTNDVNEAEIRGLWEGLCWVILQLEGDCLNTIKALQDNTGYGASCLLEDCKNLVKRVQECRVQEFRFAC